MKLSIVFGLLMSIVVGIPPVGLATDVSELRRKAESGEFGSITAQNFLGFAYMEGKGVPPDLVEAEKWFLRAAEKGAYPVCPQRGSPSGPFRLTGHVVLEYTIEGAIVDRAADREHFVAVLF